MPRIRSVHPDICSSESMSLLPAEVERTYVRLWTHMDDQGRCVDNVKLIKAAIYPLHDEMTLDVVNEHLDRLVAGRHLIDYEADGRALLQVREWTKYQHPQRPTKEKLPAFTSSARRTRALNASYGGDMELSRTEGSRRGDCADKSATVPNPRALEAVRSNLQGQSRRVIGA